MNLGDFKLGSTVYSYFTTTDPDTGAPTTLSGSPVVSVYEDDSDTQITSGVTLGVDADSRTGFNRLTIVASAGNGYEVGKQYFAVITTGTVDSVSAVGYVVAGFSVEKTGLNISNTSLSVGAIPALGIIDNGTLQSATSTTAVLRSAASFANDRLNGMTLQITGGTGVGQARIIEDYVDSTDTATVGTWTTTPDSTSSYVIFGTPPAPTTTTTNITGNITGNLTGSVGSVTGAVGSVGTNGITASSLAADAGTEIAAAVLAAAAADPIDANIEQINTVTIVGDGSGTPFNV